MARELNGEMIVQTAATPTDLTIPVGSKDPAKATQNINFACNLNKNTPVVPENATEAERAKGTWNTEFKIYDSFGNEHLLTVSFVRDRDTVNEWVATVNVDPDTETLDEDGNPQNVTSTLVGFDATAGQGNTFRVRFDNNGTLERVTDVSGQESNESGEIILQASYIVPESNDVDGNPYRQTMNINLGTIGSMINTVTQSASASSTKAFYQDGYALGYLENFKIDSTGTITGVYSNGTNRTIGQLAMATFANQNGLEKAGDNTYVKSNNSGEAKINASGIAGAGSLLAGALEMSNVVDLTEQFTDMIVTQRGFQSNAKTIQTADTLLETVLSLKR